MNLVLGVVAGLLLLWFLLVATLWLWRPGETAIRDALRLLPDLVRMLRGLAADSSLPRSIRWRLWALLGYLAFPIDLVPDFIPVLGYADDAIVVAVVLRSVVKTAGPEALEHHWPGSADGLASVRRLARI